MPWGRSSRSSFRSMNKLTNDGSCLKTLHLLNLHYQAYCEIAPHAEETGHPAPLDTRGWSQIIVSTLCGVKGLERKKGADLEDGSDVKGACTWGAIDTPRFNGVLKAGTKANASGKIDSLDGMPHLYFVMWDESVRKTVRCRIWVVRPRGDAVFRKMCSSWYEKRASRDIVSDNFQLHPPRGLDVDVFRNTCGNLKYPLYFCAECVPSGEYALLRFDPQARIEGACVSA